MSNDTKEFVREFWSKLQHWRLMKIAEHLREAALWWKK
jgi:hypothetical protein